MPAYDGKPVITIAAITVIPIPNIACIRYVATVVTPESKISSVLFLFILFFVVLKADAINPSAKQ